MPLKSLSNSFELTALALMYLKVRMIVASLAVIEINKILISEPLGKSHNEINRIGIFSFIFGINSL